MLQHVVFGGNLQGKFAAGVPSDEDSRVEWRRYDSALDDDEVFTDFYRMYSYYFGFFWCSYCSYPDVRALHGDDHDNNKVHKAWEKEFELLLLANPKGVFHGVHKCKIIMISEPSLMRPRPDDAVPVDPEEDLPPQVVVAAKADDPVLHTTNWKNKINAAEPVVGAAKESVVEVDVSCKGLRLTLDRNVGAFIGYALMESYNDAHQAFGDDYVMNHIHFEGIFDDHEKSNYLRGGGGSQLGWRNYDSALDDDEYFREWWSDVGFFFISGWWCVFCYLDDLDHRKKKSFEKVWEEGFKEMLQKHPGDAFADVTQCQIKVIEDESLMRKALATSTQ